MPIRSARPHKLDEPKKISVDWWPFTMSSCYNYLQSFKFPTFYMWREIIDNKVDLPMSTTVSTLHHLCRAKTIYYQCFRKELFFVDWHHDTTSWQPAPPYISVGGRSNLKKVLESTSSNPLIILNISMRFSRYLLVTKVDNFNLVSLT